MRAQLVLSKMFFSVIGQNCRDRQQYCPIAHKDSLVPPRIGSSKLIIRQSRILNYLNRFWAGGCKKRDISECSRVRHEVASNVY